MEYVHGVVVSWTKVYNFVYLAVCCLSKWWLEKPQLWDIGKPHKENTS